MARKWILVLLGTVLAAVRTGGRQDGAPTDACDTFTPMHGGNSAQSGDGGFKLYSDLIDNGGSYEADQEYNITLRNEDGTTVFRGFLIGARTAVGGARVGTFSTDAGSQLLDCAQFGTDMSTVTHTSNSDKQSVMFTWTAPGTSGTVEFRYAVVVSFNTFYADLELPMATQPAPSFSIQLPDTFSFNIPSTFTNPIPQPTPAVMVPDCPTTDKTEDSEFPLTFGQPAGCDRESCEVYAAMGPNAANDDFLDIYLEGTADGWVAVGFSNNTFMNNTDVVGCRISSDEVNVRDAWNPGQFNQDDEFPEYGVCTHSANYSGGRISCLISKYGMKVEEAEDLNLKDGPYWIVTGIRTDGQSVNGRFVKHTSTPTFSTAQYNPFSDSNADVVIVTDPPIVCPSAPGEDRDYNLEFGLPHGCTKANCTYYVAMGPNAEDDKFLDVYLQGTADGWVAVGFSHTTLMGDSDVLGCKVVNDTPTVVDTWNTQSYYNTLDDNQEGVCVHSSSYSNGVISCSFSRLGGDGSDSEDLPLNDDLWLMFGTRADAQQSVVQRLAKHSSTPVLSDKEYNPFTSKRKISPVPTTITCPSAPAPDAVFPVETTFNDDFYFAARINDENPEFLDMIIQASAEGWIAIGFSATRQMAETDVFACQVEPSGSVVNVKDGWNPLPNYAANQLDSTQEGICKHDATYYEGAIRCKFSRYIPSLNSGADLDLNHSLYRIYAKGNTKDLATSSLAKHESTPAVTDDTANVVAAAAAGENIQDNIYPVVELITTHGILMLFSWPLLATNAIFFASWLKPALPNGEWFKVHRAVMIISLVTTLAGFIFAFVANAKKSVPGLIEFDSSGVNTTHFVFGIIITLLHIVNPIIALLRCKPGGKWRWIFNISHAGIIGFGAQILALVNVCLGLWLLEQSHRGFYVFIGFVALFLITEVTMFILTSFLATREGVPKKEIPNLVHSSVKFCLPKSEPALETTMKEDVEMEEQNGKPNADEDSEQKKKKKPSSDARIRWASFGLFLGMSVVVFIVVAILVLID